MTIFHSQSISFSFSRYLSFSLTYIFPIQFTNSMILHNFTVRDAINLSVPLTRIGNETTVKCKGSPFIHSIPWSSWWYALWGRNHEPTSFKLFIADAWQSTGISELSFYKFNPPGILFYFIIINIPEWE